MVIWFSGNSGVGKTTLATWLANYHNGILLDGDRMRATISQGAGFSKEDRETHNLRVARLAKELDSQGYDVMVAVIAPYVELRKRIAEICNPRWVYVCNRKREAELEKLGNYPYEKFTKSFPSDLYLDTGVFCIDYCQGQLLRLYADGRVDDAIKKGFGSNA